MEPKGVLSDGETDGEGQGQRELLGVVAGLFNLLNDLFHPRINIL